MSEKQRPLLAADRVRLYLTLVPYLLEHGQVSLAEAAEEFGVTTAEMRAMVEKLTVIGLPGDSGYWQQPHEMFDIDWDLLDEQDTISITNAVALERTPRLTAREAAALLAGLQLAASLPGVGDSGVVQGLLAKLAAGASSAPAEVIVATPVVDDVRTTVAAAVQRGVAVSFEYRAPDAPVTTRTVDPVKVHIADGQWYLQGWCHLRQAVRTFHLDRVSEVVLTDIPSTHGADPLPGLFEPAESDVIVELRCRKDVVPLLGEFAARAVVRGKGDVRSVRLRVGDERSLKRLAARLGGDVEVVSPDTAREAARGWAEAGLAQYT